MYTTTTDSIELKLPLTNLPQCDVKSSFLISSSPKEATKLFKSVSSTVSKTIDVTTNILSFIRSVHDVVDPLRIFFSKKISHVVVCTGGADVFLVPGALAATIEDIVSLFALNSILAKLDALLSLLTDATDLIRNSATVLSILQELRIISEEALKWTPKFYFAAFFIDFIGLGRSFFKNKRIYLLSKTISHDLDRLQSENSFEKKTELALEILQTLQKKRDELAQDLSVSKKVLKNRIETLTKHILSKKGSVFDHAETFLVVLSGRAKVQSALAISDLVNSVIVSAGNFFAFFPPLALLSTVVLGATGVVSFVVWGISSHCISKNPFGSEILPLVEPVQA